MLDAISKFSTPALGANDVSSKPPSWQDKETGKDPGLYLVAYYALLAGIASLQYQGSLFYAALKRAADNARNDQEMANRVDEVIAEAAKGDDKTRKPLPDGVVQYMHDHGIKVDGQSIDDYIRDHGGSDGQDKGQLQAVKAALDNAASRENDTIQQGQLNAQKIFQQLNAMITQETSMLSSWGDINKAIARNF